MRTPWSLVSLGLVLCALVACGDDDPAGPGGGTPTDTTPPSPIADLRVSASTDTTLTLTWTAPGDDGGDGTAAAFDLRHSSSAISEANWASATPVSGVPAPMVAGTSQSMTLRLPLSKATVYVGMKAEDDAGNWSALSNVATGNVPDPTGIRQITFSGNNRQPWVDSGVVTWVYGDGWNEDIHRANLNAASPSITVITDDGGEKDYPSNIGSDFIVWQGRVDSSDDWEIYRYQAGHTPPFEAYTENETEDTYPMVAGGGDFTWLQGYSVYEKVMYWDASTTTESEISLECCPTVNWHCHEPAARDGVVVWRAWNHTTTEDFVATMWEGSGTDMTAQLQAPLSRNFSVYGHTVACEYSGDPVKIAYWDGASLEVVATGIEPSLYDGKIAYTYWDGHDYEIRLWDGEKVIEVTDNDYHDAQPCLNDGWLVWSGRTVSGMGQIFCLKLES